MTQPEKRRLFLDLCYGRSRDIPPEFDFIRLWHVGTTCRYCGEHVEEGSALIASSYWVPGGAFWQVCHAGCQKEGSRSEAYECQCVDADCNDCTYLTRGERHGKGAWVGTCGNAAREPRYLLPDGRILAHSQLATGHPCFVHRRDGQPVIDSAIRGCPPVKDFHGILNILGDDP